MRTFCRIVCSEPIEPICSSLKSTTRLRSNANLAAIDALGTPLPDETYASCEKTGAILLGAVGGPKWDHLKGADRPELGSLLPLRKNLNLYANIRPCKPYPALIDKAPLKRERLEGTDFVVMRELTGGIYFGTKGRDNLGAYDECRYSEAEVERITCLLYTSPSPRDRTRSRMPSSA